MKETQPDPAPFEPLIRPKPGNCVFAFYKNWLEGKTLHITKEHYGCGGAGRWMCGVEIGTTDIAMRQHIPPDILVFTVTREMFKQLCNLDEKSFLHKPFLRNLRKTRGLSDI